MTSSELNPSLHDSEPNSNQLDSHQLTLEPRSRLSATAITLGDAATIDVVDVIVDQPPDLWNWDINGNPEECDASKDDLEVFAANGNNVLPPIVKFELEPSRSPHLDDNRSGVNLSACDSRLDDPLERCSDSNPLMTSSPLPTMDHSVTVERIPSRFFGDRSDLTEPPSHPSSLHRPVAGTDQLQSSGTGTSAEGNADCHLGSGSCVESQSSDALSGQVSPQSPIEEYVPSLANSWSSGDNSAGDRTRRPRRSRGLSDVFYPTPGYHSDVVNVAIQQLEPDPSLVSEPIHMTLEEVRASLRRRLGESAPDAGRELPDSRNHCRRRERVAASGCSSDYSAAHAAATQQRNHHHRPRQLHHMQSELQEPPGSPTVRCLPRSLRHTLCHWLKIGRGEGGQAAGSGEDGVSLFAGEAMMAVDDRLLLEEEDRRANVPPPVPPRPEQLAPRIVDERLCDEQRWESVGSTMLEGANEKGDLDFTTSLQMVKNYGWYWGPISGDEAEKALAGEPNGSFLVRDSTDERYIFSLSFKLNGSVRHVRIEHDQGNFSFGTLTKFKSHTIVEFIENAVQYSLSGRFLFFLHQRPVLGPMRVQLLHPVSRFKQVQSLQHMCRFAILKIVRLDLVDRLPLPTRMKTYLRVPQYYTEETLKWPTASGGRTAEGRVIQEVAVGTGPPGVT